MGRESIRDKVSRTVGKKPQKKHAPEPGKNGRHKPAAVPDDGDPFNDAPDVAAAIVQTASALTPGDAYEGPAPPPAKPPRFKLIGSAEFAGGDFRPDWLVSRVAVKRQPMVVAGPSKAMKTSLSIDLAVSLASGREFLGAFDVPRPVRVAVVSGESGEHTLQETAARVCRAKGLALADLGDRLTWCFTLPVFSDLAGMVEFVAALKAAGVEVVIIDPLYLSLGAIDAKNMFEMGGALRSVAELLLAASITPIMLHHANRQLTVGEPMELSHLAYSGLEQFARQFVLINRREPYRSDGVHDLWVRVGGSAGHGGLWSVHVEEGVIGDDFSGREWNVKVLTPGEVQADRIDPREAEKREAARKRMQKEETAVLDAIDAEVSSGQVGATRTRMKERTGFSGAKVGEVVNGLVESGAIEEVGFDSRSG